MVASILSFFEKPQFLTEFFESLPNRILDLGIRVLLAIVLFFLGIQLIKIFRRIVKKSMDHAGAELGAIQFVDSFLKIALNVVLVFTVATSFGVDATSIVALLGSAGVAIGLALQGSLSNLAGGVLILILKPFMVGDYIISHGAGQEGTVSEIQIIYTKLTTGDNKVVVIPNGVLANNSITNVTAAHYRRVDILVGISYDSDIRLAKEALIEMLKQEPLVAKDKDMSVFVNELVASSINMGIRCWCKKEDYWTCRYNLNENTKYTLDKAGIKIPFNQLDVHMKQDS